ncbi:MAG TPA: hypothetical protein VLD35_12705 [Caldimonas sp.]|nr:hypothetical protein [Caldimonas sp.]
MRDSTSAVARLAARTGAETVVAVSNRDGMLPSLEALASRFPARSIRCLQHDNTGLEFGAYQVGLDSVREADPEWVVFANDTFAVHNCFYSVYQNRLVSALASPADDALCAAGEVVSLAKSYNIGRVRSNRWLTTSIFAINRAALRALHHRVYYPEINELIRSSSDPGLFFSEDLDGTLAAHLAGWLFGVPGQGAWYGAAPLTEESAPRLARKARSILQEKYLAALLDDAGTWFLDLNPYGVREKITRRVERAFFEARSALAGPARNLKASRRL